MPKKEGRGGEEAKGLRWENAVLLCHLMLRGLIGILDKICLVAAYNLTP